MRRTCHPKPSGWSSSAWFGRWQMSFVEISNVDLIYGGVAGRKTDEGALALSALNLRLENGDFVAVVGPSGCAA